MKRNQLAYLLEIQAMKAHWLNKLAPIKKSTLITQANTDKTWVY